MISDVYFPRINGVSTSIKTFHRELTSLGHDITLVAPVYNTSDNNEDWICRIPSGYLPLDPEDRMMRRKHITSLHDTFRHRCYDIVHIQTPFIAHYAGIDLARYLNIPRVASYHTYFEEYLYHYMPFLPKPVMRSSARWFSRRQCNDLDALIVPSAAMRDVLRGYGINRPIEIIATGIDDGFFKPGDGEYFRNRHGIERQRPVLVYVGRVAHEKNIDFLLYMLAVVQKSMPEILLIIAGEGPAVSHLQSLARNLKLEHNIKFIGYLDRNTTLLDCYRAGDVFVFSSRTETQGLVLLEAMAQGVPVVAVSALGTNDILSAGKGALVADDAVDDFAGKVIRLLREHELRQRLANDAREYARTWSAREFAIRAVAFYEQAINNYRLN